MKEKKMKGWIARDDDGELYFYEDKPLWCSPCWFYVVRNQEKQTHGAFLHLPYGLDVGIKNLPAGGGPIQATLTISLKTK